MSNIHDDQTRSKLKEKFEDNKTPTGEDFANLIEGALNLKDDGVAIEESKITMEKSLEVNEGDLIVSGSQSLGGELTVDSHLMASKCFEVRTEGKATLDGKMHIKMPAGPQAFDGDPLLFHVEGDTQIDGDAQIKGNTQFDGDTQIDGNATIGGRLNVGDVSSLKHALQLDIDGGDHETPFLIKEGEAQLVTMTDAGKVGIGDITPEALLHLSQDGGIDEPLLRVDEKGNDDRPSLFVAGDGLVGIGKLHPEAHLDVSSTHGDLTDKDIFRASNGGATQLAVAKGGQDEIQLKSDHIHIAGDTQVDDNLTVEGYLQSLTGADVIQTGADVNQTATTIRSNNTNASLKVQHQVDSETTNTLLMANQNKVGVHTDTPEAAFHVASEAQMDGDVHTKSALRVDGDSQLTSLTASQNVSMQQTLSVQGATDLQSTLNVTDTTTLSGTLNVAQSAHLQSGLIADGGTDLNAGLDVQGLTTMTQTDGPSDDGVLTVTASEAANRALRVQHDLGDGGFETILTTKDGRVGVRTDMPAVDLHVNGQLQVDAHAAMKSTMQVDGKVTLADQLEVMGTSQLSQTLHVTGATHLSDTLQVDNATTLADTFNVQGESNFGQDVGVQGHVMITQEDEGVALTAVYRPAPEGDPETFFTAKSGQVGICTDSPEAALHVADDLQVDGETTLKEKLYVEKTSDFAGTSMMSDVQVRKTLDVVESTRLQATLDVQGAAQFHSPVQFDAGISIENGARLNSPEHQEYVDMHIRQSHPHFWGLRVDQSNEGMASFVVQHNKVGVNTDSPQFHLDVNGETQLMETLWTRADVYHNAPVYAQDNIYCEQSIGFSMNNPTARIHIREGASEIALRIDSGVEEMLRHVVIRQGKVGIGRLIPTKDLDVGGDVEISDELDVFGRVHFHATLDVDRDVQLKEDLTVRDTTKLYGQTTVGHVDELGSELYPKAELFIANTRMSEAFRIQSKNDPGLVFKNGYLGLGIDDPTVTLDVDGATHLHGSVRMDEGAEINGYFKVHGDSAKAEFFCDAEVWEDMILHGDLTAKDDVEIHEDLMVQGDTELLADLRVDKNTKLLGNLTVGYEDSHIELNAPTKVTEDLEIKGKTAIQKSLRVAEDFSTGMGPGDAHCHLRNRKDQDAFVVDQQTPTDTSRLFTLNKTGQLGLGTVTPQSTLDIVGDGSLSGDLTVQGQLMVGQSLSVDHHLDVESLAIAEHFTLNDGPTIYNISTADNLGGDSAQDGILPTQAAVKSYVDQMVLPFGRGGKTHIITNQDEFDTVFHGIEDKVITEDTTIILLPFKTFDFEVGAYQLRNSVRLKSGVSIIGFNEKSTIIEKAGKNHRFKLMGQSDAPVRQVHLSGFTFNGNGHRDGFQATHDGGAFYLEHAQHCQLNCLIDNHQTWGSGGAIYAALQTGDFPYTASHIEAKHIHRCYSLDQGSGSNTQLNEGGAAFGLYRSVIHAYNCSAELGGGLSRCKECVAETTSCMASRGGGGAYRCPQLQLKAVDCKVSLTNSNGRGGAAYYCSDLICEGLWMGNNAADGPHIYASNSLTGDLEERHYWKGDFVGRRIDNTASVWRSHNE
ncbi:hypothetical protein [Algicola sagamiensis]|uniref:hypothetical protein n=1 Tax=Algicola sagamiensis TaxID=163869 RepID=UPI00037D3424|nr:hypothetical protein [Algicola sagamiensis]